MRVGRASAFEAELWGAVDGLSLAKSHGYEQVELQLDATAVVKCLQGCTIGSVHGL